MISFLCQYSEIEIKFQKPNVLRGNHKTCRGGVYPPFIVLYPTDNRYVFQTFSKRLFENFFVWDLTLADPPKSPLKRGTLRNLAPLCKAL